MKPYAISLAMAAGLLLTGCETKRPAYSGATYGPATTTTYGTSAYGPYRTLTVDEETRARLELQAPQTYARIYQSQPLSVTDVNAMAHAGIGDDDIIRQVSATRSVYHLTASDIIDLHNNGVSERVIDSMINTSSSVYTSPVTGRTIIVNQPPPAAPAETVVATPPAPDYVWIPGEWTWSDRWVWLPGHWGPKPYGNAVWVKGAWVRTQDGYRHNPGHWQ